VNKADTTQDIEVPCQFTPGSFSAAGCSQIDFFYGVSHTLPSFTREILFPDKVELTPGVQNILKSWVVKY